MNALVIGVGNADRGDDAVGLVVARALRSRRLGGVEVCECSGEATALIDAFAKARQVFIVDAARMGEAAGVVRRFDAAAGALPRVNPECSSHGFGVAQGIELARALDSLPDSCVLFAVQGKDYGNGQPLSAAVQAAAAQVEESIARELQGGRAATAPLAG